MIMVGLLINLHCFAHKVTLLLDIVCCKTKNLSFPAPQTQPNDFVLTAESAYSVRFAWTEPDYLNSPPSEVYYQVGTY